MYTDEEIKTFINLEDYIRKYNGQTFPHVKSMFLVVFDAPEGYEDKYPFKSKKPMLFLGELPGQPGHGIFAVDNGNVYFGYHLDNFYVISRDEI